MAEKIIAVLGPTASGKTALAVELALRLGGEIVSCDSMQIYRGMNIGTAKPTDDEKRGVPHHMIDIVDPRDSFSCADYVSLAKPIVADIAARGKKVIFCGGTGLYFDSLTTHSEMSDEGRDDKIRSELTEYAEKHGNLALHQCLREVDPTSADTIHPSNVRRVIRALEIYKTTGITKTEWDKRSKESPSEYDVTAFVLDYFNRDILYSRIDTRVDEMIKDGLEDEVRRLYESHALTPDSAAAQAIGYKEFADYLKGEITLSDAADRVKLASRRYAKRQITWFKRREDSVKLHPDQENDPTAALKSSAELADEAEAYLML